MGLIATQGKEFKRLAEGTHLAICVGVIDLGIHTTTFKDKGETKTATKTLFLFETPHELDEEEKPFLISCRHNLSLYETSGMAKMLVSWRGKKFTAKELEGFNVNNVLTAPCFITVVNSLNEQTGKAYLNIKSISNITKGTLVPDAFSQPLIFDADAPEAWAWKNMPKWVRKTIEKADNWLEIADKLGQEAVMFDCQETAHEEDEDGSGVPF